MPDRTTECGYRCVVGTDSKQTSIGSSAIHASMCRVDGLGGAPSLLHALLGGPRRQLELRGTEASHPLRQIDAHNRFRYPAPTLGSSASWWNTVVFMSAKHLPSMQSCPQPHNNARTRSHSRKKSGPRAWLCSRLMFCKTGGQCR